MYRILHTDTGSHTHITPRPQIQTRLYTASMYTTVVIFESRYAPKTSLNRRGQIFPTNNQQRRTGNRLLHTHGNKLVRSRNASQSCVCRGTVRCYAADRSFFTCPPQTQHVKNACFFRDEKMCASCILIESSVVAFHFISCDLIEGGFSLMVYLKIET